MEALNESTNETLGTVLLVDDSPAVVAGLSFALEEDFKIITADSGEACLEYLASSAAPDLILLDIEMNGIDGFETCRRLRAEHDMPVIFVSSYDDLPERIKAFDSGGNDFLVKPAEPEVVQRKARLAVQQHSEKKRLTEEKASLHTMAMDFLRNMGESGVLLNFMRGSLATTDHQTLARRLLDATAEYGVKCCVQIRHAGGAYTLTPDGVATPLEVSVIEKSATMGRIFQFSRRMVVNYDLVSVLIVDLPEDETTVGKLRDNIAILVESAEAMAETISLRREADERSLAIQKAADRTAEAVAALRELYRKQQTETRLSLESMIESIEKAYVHLGLTDGQESRISDIMRNGAEHALHLFDQGIGFDRHFASILETLNACSDRNSAHNRS